MVNIEAIKLTVCLVYKGVGGSYTEVNISTYHTILVLTASRCRTAHRESAYDDEEVHDEEFHDEEVHDGAPRG